MVTTQQDSCDKVVKEGVSKQVVQDGETKYAVQKGI